MKIGITIQIKENFSFQSNGMYQNLVFLAKAFNSIKNWKCYFLFTGKEGVNLFIPPDNCINIDYFISEKPFQFDVIVLGGFISDKFESTSFSKTKFIAFHCGATLVDDMFHCLADDTPMALTAPNIKIDEIWTLPHHSKNLGYLSTFYDTENSKIVPYVWDDTFISSQIKDLGFKDVKHYKKLTSKIPPSSINIYEPNNTVSKTCLIPLSIAVAHRRHGAKKIKGCNIFSTNKIAKSRFFISRCRSLGILESAEIRNYFSFYPRTPFIQSLSTFGHGAIVVSHQLAHELNNLYFDALFLGIPLIHNSNMLSKYGYYYKDADIKGASRIIDDVVRSHNKTQGKYNDKNSELFDLYHPENPSNLNEYIKTLQKLIQ